jgi:hypothetical protein
MAHTSKKTTAVVASTSKKKATVAAKQKPSALAKTAKPVIQDRRPSMTAEQVLEEIEVAFKKLDGLIENLLPQEQALFCERLKAMATQKVMEWWAVTVREMNPEQLTEFIVKSFADVGWKWTEETFHGIKEMGKRIEAKVKDHYTVKPRMTARDEEVKRLVEQEKLDWKEIAKRIRSNSDWAENDHGKPVTARALMTAYHRPKKAAK